MTIDPTPAQTISTEHPTDLQVVGESYMLRLANADDAEQLLRLGEDPAVTRFFSWGPYTSIEQPQKYIEDLQAKRDNGALLEFVIVERETDQIVGVTGLTEFSKRDRRAVVGSWLGHKYWGTGVNVASKSLVLGLGFRQLGLERISSYSHVRNGRSKAALERIGFVGEGILHAWHWHHGEPQDVNIHCLLREIYERSEIGSDKIEITGTVPAAFLP
ncbi:MAG: GNAT family N-acetyltransferase [Thermoleophilaceae bacterium]|nr:GNAT family N-acetyltransferase [Thermoleophilaceae bacterium]